MTREGADAVEKARVAQAVLLAASLAALACNPLGPPPRIKTHGYQAVATRREALRETRWEIAVRDENRRREPPAGQQGAVLVLRGKERQSFEIDRPKRTYTEVPFTSLDTILPGHPLEPGWNEHAEAARRGVEEYHRESDTVFGGNVAWIWSFDDTPGDEMSPWTTYWVVQALDLLVVRVDRQTPHRDGRRTRVTTELTSVRIGADPELFEVPKGYLKVAAPGS